jgi:MYXO-CTERM domain-containing protein
VNRFVLITLTVAFLTLLGARDAFAQGTCVCNNGCHSMPGQCLISGTGCTAGYAPLCDYRPSGTCPQIGSVSCSGMCVCTPIPGYDAGTPDVPMTPMDASGDVPGGSDVVTPSDTPTPSDVPPGEDGSTPSDVITPGDTPTPEDVPSGEDAMTGTDATDAPVVDCPTGVVVDGVCYSTPCEYQMEIGFVCTMQGFSCRQIDGNAWCIPVCAGNMCETGTFCDPTFGCTPTPDGGLDCTHIECQFGQVCDPASGCIMDRCTGVPCPTGQYCVRGECIFPPDVVDTDSGSTRMDGGMRADGSIDGSSADGGHGGQNACACRTPGGGSSPRGLPMALLALGAVIAVRRRSRR